MWYNGAVMGRDTEDPQIDLANDPCYDEVIQLAEAAFETDISYALAIARKASSAIQRAEERESDKE